MRKSRLVTILLAVVVIAGLYYYLQPQSTPASYKVVNTFPHDPSAFTQGFEFVDDLILEGTGLYGKSSIRYVDLETGEVINSVSLSDNYFGEGVTRLGSHIYQLTWRENTCLVYDLALNYVNSFSYEGEGWGLANDGEHLIMSDGTPFIRVIDPEGFTEVNRINIQDDGEALRFINELEYVDVYIYANIWQTDQIVVIDATTGKVRSTLDLSELTENHLGDQIDVLNGIAYNSQSDTFFITGKLWPTIYEIEITLGSRK